MPHYADTSNYSPAEISLWEKLIEKEGVGYHTAKNLPFTYTIRGNELFISRKAKSITRAIVNMAYKRAVELMELGCVVTGPKMLGVYGASYLYGVFKAWRTFKATVTQTGLLCMLKPGHLSAGLNCPGCRLNLSSSRTNLSWLPDRRAILYGSRCELS